MRSPAAAGQPWPTSATGLLAVLGDPVRHSLSPTMHNAALAHAGIDAAYLALPTPPSALGSVVAGLAATGALGVNVTVPHKVAVVDHCDALTDEARLIGAVNTLVLDDGRVTGDNTDASGLARALVEEAGLRPGARWVLLGTGGAARAAAVAAARLEADLLVVGRRPEAAAELADLARRAGAGDARSCGLDDAELAGAVGGADLLCNATPLGMDGERLPAAFHRLTAGQIAYDLVYRPPDTPFVVDAAAAGADAHHGLSMLVGQAADALERWGLGPAPVEVMRAAAEAALWPADG